MIVKWQCVKCERRFEQNLADMPSHSLIDWTCDACKTPLRKCTNEYCHSLPMQVDPWDPVCIHCGSETVLA